MSRTSGAPMKHPDTETLKALKQTAETDPMTG